MESRLYKLAGFVLHDRYIDSSVETEVKNSITRGGFELLQECRLDNGLAEDDINIPYREATTDPKKFKKLFIAVDLWPWVSPSYYDGTDREGWEPTTTAVRQLSVGDHHQLIDNARLLRVKKWNSRIHNAMKLEPLPICAYVVGEKALVRVLRAQTNVNLTSLFQEANSLEESFASPFPVIKTFTGLAHHARIDLVEFEKSVAVCKTFKPTRTFAYQHELQAAQLHDELSCFPKLLRAQEPSIIYEYYINHEENIRNVFGLLPIETIQACYEAIKELYQLGYIHNDLATHNIIFCSKNDIKLVDLESVVSEKTDSEFATCGSIFPKSQFNVKLGYHFGISQDAFVSQNFSRMILERCLFVAFRKIPEKIRSVFTSFRSLHDKTDV